MREPLDWEQSTEEVLVLMSEGDPEALGILTEIVSKNAVGAQIVLDMDDMNIRGKQIVVGVQACLGSIKRFVNMIYHRTPWLVQEINKEMLGHRAVESGASDAPPEER